MNCMKRFKKSRGGCLTVEKMALVEQVLMDHSPGYREIKTMLQKGKLPDYTDRERRCVDE